MKNFKNNLAFKNKNLGLFLRLTVLAIFGILSFSTQAMSQQLCTPSVTLLEGDLVPGGILYFRVTGGQGSVTIDALNIGSGLKSLTVVNNSNALITIPDFEPGEFDPVTVNFKVYFPHLPVDFKLRVANSISAAFVRVRCDGIPPMIISDDPGLYPGGLNAFEAITATRNSVIVDPVNSGTGLQSLSVVSATNAVINIDSFTRGTYQPKRANYTIIDRSQPVEFTLRATNQFHGVIIKVLIGSCGTNYVTDDEIPGSASHFIVTPAEGKISSGTLNVQTIDDLTGMQTLSVVNASNAQVDIPAFKEGTLDPVEINFIKYKPDMPSCITLKATTNQHSVLIVVCSC